MRACFWLPAHEPRRTRPWWDSQIAMATSMSGYTAERFYRHVNLFPIAKPYANDRDHARW